MVLKLIESMEIMESEISIISKNSKTVRIQCIFTKPLSFTKKMCPKYAIETRIWVLFFLGGYYKYYIYNSLLCKIKACSLSATTHTSNLEFQLMRSPEERNGSTVRWKVSAIVDV